LRRVRYGTDAAKDLIESALTMVAEFNLNHPGVKAHYAGLLLRSVLTTIKHPGFAEEREWRTIVATERTWMTKDLSFRTTPVAIVPFIELPLPREAIRTIRVGPGRNADARAHAVGTVLEAHDMKIDVLRSDVPLRT
jgi:hypothetical protein